jgi:DDE family transposase
MRRHESYTWRMNAPDLTSPLLNPAVALPPEPVVGDIETFLQEILCTLRPEEEEAPSAGRPRVLPALCLWAGLLVCVVRGFSSQLAVWRLLSVQGLWHYPRFAVSDQAIYKRLSQAGSGPLVVLFEQVRSVLAARLAPFQATEVAPFAVEVLALDETTLDQVARSLPTLRAVPSGDRRLLPGKLAGLFDLRRQHWHAVQYVTDSQQNEKVTAPALLRHAPLGSLLVMDLGYFSFAWFDHLTDQGYFWVSRLRQKTSYTVLHTYYQDATTFDGVVWLGAHRADRAAHAVRLVSFQVEGKVYRYLTNVREPQQLSLHALAGLYQRRWDIELAVKLVKRHLKLHLIWSSKVEVVQLQVWAVLIVAQILHALQVEIARRAGVEVFDVSLALLVEYLPHYAAQGIDPVAAFVEHGVAARFIRPSSRTPNRAPQIALDLLLPLPPDLSLERPPRYAQRKCQRHVESN